MDLLTKAIALLTAVMTMIAKIPDMAAWWEKRRTRLNAQTTNQPTPSPITKAPSSRRWSILASFADTVLAMGGIAMLWLVTTSDKPVTGRSLGLAAFGLGAFMVGSLRPLMR